MSRVHLKISAEHETALCGRWRGKGQLPRQNNPRSDICRTCARVADRLHPGWDQRFTWVSFTYPNVSFTSSAITETVIFNVGDAS
jgi:hypothetical protein